METSNRPGEPSPNSGFSLDELRALLAPNTFFEPIAPNAKTVATHDAHGLTWLEPIVHACFPDADIFPPVIASSLYGGYFSEIDKWRAHTVPALGSYQGAVIRSKGLDASCLHLANRDGLVGWYGKKYEGKTVSIILLDDTMLRVAATSLYELIVNPYRSPRKSLVRIAEQGFVAPDQRLAATLACDSHKKYCKEIFAARKTFLTAYSGLRDEQRFHWFPLEIGLDGLPDQELVLQMYRYCESMVIHFLMGHEIGHYYYQHAVNRNPKFKDETREAAQQLLSREFEVDDGLAEEMYCDTTGLNNCLFQRVCFDVPYSAVIYAPMWVLILTPRLLASSAVPTSEHSQQLTSFESRQLALQKWWLLRNADSADPDFGHFSEQAREALTKVAPSVSSLFIPPDLS